LGDCAFLVDQIKFFFVIGIAYIKAVNVMVWIMKRNKEFVNFSFIYLLFRHWRGSVFFNVLSQLFLQCSLSVGRTVSADIFCAEITAGKSQRLKEITTAVGKSKHEF
jgi:hypothetical protein